MNKTCTICKRTSDVVDMNACPFCHKVVEKEEDGYTTKYCPNCKLEFLGIGFDSECPECETKWTINPQQKPTEVIGASAWRNMGLKYQYFDYFGYVKKEEFITGQRCHDCGEKKESDLSDSCGRCLEEK